MKLTKESWNENVVMKIFTFYEPLHDLIGSHWINLQVIISMVSSAFLDRESSEAYIEFLVKQCAIPVAQGRPNPNNHGATENGRARELPDVALNKVLITIHRIRSL